MPADDDLCLLTALLPAAQAMAIYHRLDDVAARAQADGDERTRPQLRADAMCELLLDDEGPRSQGDSGDAAAAPRPPEWVRGIRPTVVLTVPVLALLGRSDEPADLEGFGPIDIDTARRLAGEATSFIRVLTHPETGAVLSVGRDRYRVPADLKAALAIRDETCRFPGCRRRARRCDLDHSTAWQHGGRTDACNLAHLCRKHHRLKHELGWSLTHHGGGALTWTSPVGRAYRSEPARQLWPRRPERATSAAEGAAAGREGPPLAPSRGDERPSPAGERSSGCGPPAIRPAPAGPIGYPDEPPF